MPTVPMEFMTQVGHHNTCDATSATSSAVGTRSCACAALRQRQSRLRKGRLSDLRRSSHENGFEQARAACSVFPYRSCLDPKCVV